MEVSYGIGVKNRYALFMEDVDPLDLISNVDLKKTRDREVKEAPATEVKGGKVDQGKGGDFKGRAGRGRGGDAGGDNHGKRENEKHSVSDKSTVKPAEKREGAGSFNRSSNSDDWGTKRDAPAPMDKNKKNAKENGTNTGKNRKGAFDDFAPPSREEKPREEHKSEDDHAKQLNYDDSKKLDYGTRTQPKWDARKPDRGGRGGRGRGGFRGRGRGRGGYDNRGKREYDRHSGSDKSGVKPVEKREGTGSFNWGSVVDDWGTEPDTTTPMDENQEITDENGTTAGKKEETFEDWAGPPSSEEKPKEEPKPEDEQAKQLTYDEWKKLEDEKRVQPKWNLRKPGEGEENNPEFKKGYVLKKKDDDGNDDDDEYEEIEVEIRHGREKKLLDIEINFKDENRDMRRGRGRGGPRGGRGSGRGRGAGDRDGERRRGPREKEQSAPKVDDLEAFPSLSTA